MECMQAVLIFRERRRQERGFTLIELMIVVTVLAILAAVAIPSYRQYNMRANRSAAAQLLLNIQNREEQLILDARCYSQILGLGPDASAACPSGLNITQDGWTCTPATATTCTNNFYTVSVTVAAGPPPSYTITAVPFAGKYQASDGTLTLTSTGVRSRSAGDGKW